jgi:hypothetical protein
MGLKPSVQAVFGRFSKMMYRQAPDVSTWFCRLHYVRKKEVSMSKNVAKNAKEILEDPEKLLDFSKLNRITTEAAEEILKRLSEKPEIADEFKKYIFAEERSDDFKGYTAGESTGHSRGHEAGFAKGAMLGALATIGTLTAAGIAILFSKK